MFTGIFTESSTDFLLSRRKQLQDMRIGILDARTKVHSAEEKQNLINACQVIGSELDAVEMELLSRNVLTLVQTPDGVLVLAN